MKQISVFFVIGHGFTTLSSLQNLLKALYAELYFVQVPLAKEADPADKICFFHFDGIWLKFFIKFFRFFGIILDLIMNIYNALQKKSQLIARKLTDITDILTK